MKILFAGSDYEGRIGFVQRAFADLNTMLLQAGFVGEIPQLIENPASGEQSFLIPDNFIFGQLGDVIDHGKYDIRLQRALIDAKNIFTLIGNRDANKIRMLVECRDKYVIISNALLNNVGAWDSDNHNRRNPNNCFLAFIFKMLQEKHNAKFTEITEILKVRQFVSMQDFLMIHVTPAQETFERKLVTPYSNNYILARAKIENLLSKIEFRDLQIAAIKWNLDYTMGSAAGQLWDGAWNNRKTEINELNQGKLTDVELENLTVESYVNPESKYNLSVKYLETSAIAKRIGNVISVHGCLTTNSFKIPGTNLNIESFAHIDEWIVAINAAYKDSLRKFISGEELQADDLAVFSFTVRFGLGGGRTNVSFLKQEYANQIQSINMLPAVVKVAFEPEIRRLEMMLARLEILAAQDGIGSTIGNNQYVKLDGQTLREEYKEVGFKLDKPIIDLLKRSVIENLVIQVGHAPTGDAGLAAVALYEEDGKLIKSNVSIYSIDPTYADQSGTSLLTFTVFSELGNSKTILISRRNASAELEFSAIDVDGKRRKIDSASLSFGATEFGYKFTDEVYCTFKDTKGMSFETVSSKDSVSHFPKPKSFF